MSQERPRASAAAPRARAAALAPVLAAGRRRGLDLRLGLGLPALWGWLAGQARREAERRRLFLWLPAFMGLGILAYFAADREPALWPGPVAFSLAGIAALAARNRPALRNGLVALAAVFAGFTAASWRTAEVAAPILDRVRIAQIAGFVESVEVREGGGSRLVIALTSLSGLDPAQRPGRIRIGLRETQGLSAGDHVRATARLLPPPGPARPGGYDFARDAFFRGIGAVGSVTGRVTLAPTDVAMPRGLALTAAIDRARNALTERIASVGGGQAGAMAAALVTGKRGLIAEDTNADLRAAGIYHIVSISGLHMVLAAGTIFWLVRALLALSQTIALRWPVKKIAAVAAMAGSIGYCVFSGAEVATVRSLIMTLVMLGAILVDRPALSMRNLALAALIVLWREPEALLGPSFQMSFGAVAALIAFAERWRERDRDRPPPSLPWPLRPLIASGVGIVVTTIVATVATAPFGAYHFQTFNPFGLLGNALALPFVSLIVMPAAVAGMLAWPFGLDAPAWALMGWASALVLRLADWVAGFDHSSVVMPAFGAAALIGFSLALLWACLWSTALRFAAIVPLAIGLGVAARPHRPDILVERDASGLLVRAASGRFVAAGKPSNFVLQQWLTADGDNRKPDAASLREGAACDPAGCVLRTASGRSVAYSRDRITVMEDCLRADLVVTPLTWTTPCKATLIDRSRLDREGALAVSESGAGWTVATARQPEIARPWLRTARPVAEPQPPRPAPLAPDDDPL